jgi:hypothetical protein
VVDGEEVDKKPLSVGRPKGKWSCLHALAIVTLTISSDAINKYNSEDFDSCVIISILKLLILLLIYEHTTRPSCSTILLEARCRSLASFAAAKTCNLYQEPVQVVL